MPASSASPELKAMVFCVVDQRLVAREPLRQTPPRAVRRVSRQPAMSASMFARKVSPPSCRGKR
eukprot:7115104-Alexandrium_andersonii.AAC.1